MKTKSIRIYEQGSYDVLKIEETNISTLKSNEVLIKHHYLGLNYIDINQRNGSYKIKELPTNVGMEASGIIEEVGKDVKRFKVGDKITHCMNLGSFTEYFFLNEKPPPLAGGLSNGTKSMKTCMPCSCASCAWAC